MILYRATLDWLPLSNLSYIISEEF